MKRSILLTMLALGMVPSAAWGFGLKSLTDAAGSATGAVASGASGSYADTLIYAATARFLRGAERLAEAVGDDTKAAKFGKLRAKAEDGDVVDLSDVQPDLESLSGDEDKLRKAESSKVMEAAVDVGAASLIEGKAVDMLRKNPKAAAANPITAARLAKVTPTNLKAMLSVQSSLFSYLKNKGEDPTAAAQKAAETLEKG